MSDVAIEVLHIGSASRDLSADDPRGWRLGGGVSYAALTTARLGLRTAAVLGADAVAASASELDELRAAGVALLVAPLAESPAFRNVEMPAGRRQTCVAPGDPLPRVPLPAAWAAARAWSFVPVAGEIGEAWASLVPLDVSLAIGWQGWLRELVRGSVVMARAPGPSALLRRANLIGVSRHDLAPDTDLAGLRRLLDPAASLVITDGKRGGQLVRVDRAGEEELWRYDAIEPDVEIDPTGAGDVFLATLVATVARPSLVPSGGREPGLALAFAAAAASLVVEGPGLLGVPDLAAVQARMERGLRGRGEASVPG